MTRRRKSAGGGACGCVIAALALPCLALVCGALVGDDSVVPCVAGAFVVAGLLILGIVIVAVWGWLGDSVPRVRKAPRARRPGRREGIPADLRERIVRRDGYRCRYCGGRAATMHVDHIVPVSQGGSTTAGNLVAACPRCNLRKGGRTPSQAGMRLRRQS